MRVRALPLCAMVLAGFGIGRVLGSFAEQDQVAEPRAPELAQPLPERSESTTPDPPGLDEIIARVAPAPRGTGRIEGRLIDHLHTPIAGTAIRVEPLVDLSRGTEIERIERALAREDGVRAVHADEQGQFEVDGLREGEPVRLSIAEDELVDLHENEIERIALPGEFVDLIGAIPGTIDSPFAFDSPPAVTVGVLVAGRPVDRAIVEVSGGESAAGSVPAQGPMRIPASEEGAQVHLVAAGPWQLRATAHGALASPSREVSDRENLIAPLELAPATSLHGRWWVEGGLKPALVRAGEPPLAIAIHSYEGGFEAIGLEPGRYELHARDGEQIVDRWEVEVVPGYNRVEIVRPFDESEADVVIDVVAEDGAPVTGLRTFRIRADRKGPGSFGTSEAPVHEDHGRYWIRASEFLVSALAGGGFDRLTFSVDTGAIAGRVDAAADSWRGHHRIVVPIRADIEVHVDGYVGSGFEGRIGVELLDPRGARVDPAGVYRRAGGSPLGPGGHARYEHCELGVHTVVATYTSSEKYARRLEYYRRAVPLGAAGALVQIPLPRLVEWTILFPEEARGLRYRVNREDQSISGGEAAAEVVLSTFAGSYEIGVNAQRRTVEIRGGERISFEPIRYRAAEVVRVRERGAGSGLEVGDRVIAVFGSPLLAAFPEVRLCELGESTDPVWLTIVRGAETLEVPVPGAALATRGVWFRGVDPAE